MLGTRCSFLGGAEKPSPLLPALYRRWPAQRQKEGTSNSTRLVGGQRAWEADGPNGVAPTCPRELAPPDRHQLHCTHLLLSAA